MSVESLSSFREIRTRGAQYKAGAYPFGTGGVNVSAGRVAFDVKPGDAGSERVLRSEIVGNYATRFGVQRMRAKFRIQKFWKQQAAICGWAAVADLDDSGVHNSPLSLLVEGDMASLWLRHDTAPTSTGDAPAVRIGQRQLVQGRWYLLDVEANFSWQSDGYVHAGLTDCDAAVMERIGDAVGPNCYNDIRPPYPFFGVYWWAPTGDPMAIQFAEFSVV